MKLLIRAIITRQIILGIQDETFFSEVIELIVDFFMKDGTLVQYSAYNTIRAYFEKENPRFIKTIKLGQRELEKMLKGNRGETLSGLQIVILEKRWGLPGLLIANILRQKGLLYSKKEYQEALNLWKKPVT